MRFVKQCLGSLLGAIILLLLTVIPNILTLGIIGAIAHKKYPVKIVKEE